MKLSISERKQFESVLQDNVIARRNPRSNLLTPCWEWQLGTAKGYGYMTFRDGQDYAHRVSYAVFEEDYEDFNDHGERICVLHRCDNPACCNPDHLFLGTQLENIRDRDRKGRQVTKGYLVAGEKHGMAKLTDEKVRQIHCLAMEGFRQDTIAEMYGVTRFCISLILRGKRWIHIYREFYSGKIH